ncbi:MAG: zinc-binding dehydrogenase, partial [Anaerolineales bacterium]|nr:zinc-binding dehydrogenase [Anaerolineales bacterium]
WVKIKTRYGGICGTDTGTIHLHTSPYMSPWSSFPFTFGHENFGTIAQVGAHAGDFKIGERVVVEPMLWCKPRGFQDLCRFCARGETNLCERLREGSIAPGVGTGFCRDTGGSWSEQYAAHASQVFRVPGNVNDENAVLVEPFAIGLHAALQFPPRDDDTVLIMGAGIIGLLTLAALRQTGCTAKIWVVARYPFQADAARKLGVSEIIDGKQDYSAEIAKRTGGEMLKPIIGKRVLSGGGVDVTYECVGTDDSIDDTLRLTRTRGRVVIVGVPGIPKTVDWTPIFAKELDVVGAYNSNHAEPYRGEKRGAFDLALELMQNGLDLSWLVTHKFKLAQYGEALALLEKRSASKVIKAVFEF